VTEKRTRRKTTYKNADLKEPVILTPRNDKQAEYISALKRSEQVIVTGPAGTGKTYISASWAASQYNIKAIDKIIITRPHVPVGKDIGYLPGTLEEKVLPWAMPVIDVLILHLGKGAVETALKNGNIEIVPLALIRGRSFDNAIILVDEAQNLTVPEMKAMLTRVGEGSQIILDGDVEQADIKEQSGLAKIVHLAKKHQMDVPVIEFTVEDVVRSGICKAWLKVFRDEGL
jgi:phosphate starvation-inducible protein PhoH and related proteins